jgi:hypothetical protein
MAQRKLESQSKRPWWKNHSTHSTEDNACLDLMRAFWDVPTTVITVSKLLQQLLTQRSWRFRLGCSFEQKWSDGLSCAGSARERERVVGILKHKWSDGFLMCRQCERWEQEERRK